MRELAHAYTEDTQVKWNGVLGRMELKAENDVKLQQVNVYPDIAGKRIKVKAVLVRTNPQTTQAEVTLQVNCAETGKSYEPQTYPAAFPHDTVCIEKEYALGEDMRLWDEFSPTLYTLQASCHTRQGTDRYETTFGMREIGHTDGYLTINGNRIFLRGTLECCIFPLTGTPPTDEAGWEKVFSTAKAWGLNHLRFHSYCPPEAAFKVADRMGFYLQVELPNWSLTVGKDTATNRFLYQEFDRIIAAYGNHPSFCMLSEKATWTTNETFAAQVGIANYYKEDIRGKHILWQLTDKTGYEVGRGKLDAGTFKKGTVTSAGEIHVGLEKMRNATQLYLKATIEDTDWENSWSIWVYPPLKELNAGDVVLTQDISQALSALEAGKKVLLSPRPDKLEGLEGKFLPVFWSPVHFPKQAGTMGILCDPKHPALLHFPTEMHSDWQWWNLVKHSKVLVMDSLPDLQPIIEVTDNFVNNRRLASVFETKYGKGKLIMSSIDLLSTESKQKPEVKQLLYSLTQYMNSADFVPTGTVSKQDLLSFFSKQNKGVEKRTDARSIYEE
ncbi:hypothetical protein [Bacteroides sp. An269]|uniref:hypothetical protein n=1 Tax=Bacteroides sp. An269 TaxID=1965613 RepID=UPI000B377CB5|nr:hypothetical protein [Bacteroides sp. An269]OUO73224.1 hypothetical protein B5F71_13115 [Bacteroides sp. An269]